MALWQRRARLVIAIIGIAFAVFVARAFRARTPIVPPATIERSDPNAVVEAAGGYTLRFNRDKEEIRIDHEKTMSRADGSTELQGVTVTSERGGRTFIVKGDRATITNQESDVVLEGNVRLAGNDGLVVTGDRAIYGQNDGIVRAAGLVHFSRGRMKGTAVGMTYDKNQDVLTMLDQVIVQFAASEDEGPMEVASGTAEFRRPEHVILFGRSVEVVREGRTMTAATGVARVGDDDSTVQALELRGGSRIQDVPSGPGGLEMMTATDMDLKYGVDGRSLERALLTGDAVVQVAGQAGQGGRRIGARVLDIAVSGDSTPTAVVARNGVQLQIPADADGPIRTITAQTLDAAGEGNQGLRTAHFTGDVQYRERGPKVDRAARSGVLDVTLGPGLGALEEARFSRAVRFEESRMAADAAAARYVLDRGILELSGREPGREKPHVTHERFGVYATTVEVVLEGPNVHASGDVKSVMQPSTSDASDKGATLPSMLKRDQVVNVTANELRYDASASKATYTGAALLWQGETSIKAETITLDDKKGDVLGSGQVATSMVLEQTGDKGVKERVRTTTTSKDFVYEEASRKATYTGDAHVISAQGDMTAARVELFLKTSGDQLDRAEAYETVTLRERARKTTGARLTYYSADDRYVMTGTPVTIVDQCARETIGRTLTFYRTVDRIVVDGSEQIRTQTKGGSQCSGN